MTNKEWYGAKCIFQHNNLAPEKDETVYEERIVLVRADSSDEAIELGEHEAREYAASFDDVEYIDFINLYQIGDIEIDEGAEVYSIMRQNKLDASEFLDHYYDDGSERTQKAKD